MVFLPFSIPLRSKRDPFLFYTARVNKIPVTNSTTGEELFLFNFLAVKYTQRKVLDETELLALIHCFFWPFFFLAQPIGLIRLSLASVSGAVAREPIDLQTSNFVRMLLIPRRFAD
jgi:hypothetical protein